MLPDLDLTHVLSFLLFKFANLLRYINTHTHFSEQFNCVLLLISIIASVEIFLT